MTLSTFLVRHKLKIISIVCGAVAGALVALALLGAILFGYYQVSPQDVFNITIQKTEIQGTTKEDGSPINGFLISTEDDERYLITDYWNPIQLTNESPEVQ